jgi:hypothetical protein
MDKLSATRSVLAQAFIAPGSDPDEGYWYEGASAEIEIERTDEDEIRVGTHVGGQLHESAGIYLKRSEAIRLMLALAGAIGDR